MCLPCFPLVHGKYHQAKEPQVTKMDLFYQYYTRDQNKQSLKTEKIKCVVHYISRLAENIPDRYVIFQRLKLDTKVHGGTSPEDWKKCNSNLKNIEINEKGKIEEAIGAIEVDFANKYLGGAVMTPIQSQEEMMFIVAPECLVGVLFAEFMNDKEAILIQGTEVYCSHTGYASSFMFAGKFEDKRDVKDNILQREIIAIDALKFGKGAIPEYSVEAIVRELTKAYIGFIGGDDLGSQNRKRIATGRWGCGAFKGDSRLKFLIQWIAASRANRDLIFHSFEDTKLRDALKILKKYENKPAGTLVQDILTVAPKLIGEKKVDIFKILLKQGE